MNNINEIIADRLNKRCQELKFSQKQLAEMTNINIKTLGHYFTGNTKATIDNLVLISKALNCSIDYLVGIDENTEDAVLIDILHNDQDLKNYVLSRRAK